MPALSPAGGQREQWVGSSEEWLLQIDEAGLYSLFFQKQWMSSKGQATLGRGRQGPRAHEAGGWRKGGGWPCMFGGIQMALGLQCQPLS